MDIYNNQEYYNGFLDIFNEYLVNEMIASQIIKYMSCLNKYQNKILNAERKSPKEANQLFLNLLKNVSFENNPGYFREFLEALKHSGFERIYKRLQLENVKNDDKFRKIIKKYRNAFESVSVNPLSQDLYRSNLISDDDFYHIRIMMRTKQPDSYIIKHILSVLPFKKENWFPEFIKSLKRCKEIKVLELIDPKFIDDENSQITQICNDLETINTIKDMPQESTNSTLCFAENIKWSNFISLNLPDIFKIPIYPFIEEFIKAKLINTIIYEDIKYKYERNDYKHAYSEFFNKTSKLNNFIYHFVKVLIKTKENKLLMDLGWDSFKSKENETMDDKLKRFVKSFEIQEISFSKFLQEDNEIKDDKHETDFIKFSHECTSNNLDNFNPRANLNDTNFLNDNAESGIINLKESDYSIDFSIQQDNININVSLPNSQKILQETEKIPNRILISGLSNKINVDLILDHFYPLFDFIKNNRNGKSVQLLIDKNTNKLNGRAVIEFTNASYAIHAIEIYNGTYLAGNQIGVKIAERIVKKKSISAGNSLFNDPPSHSSSDINITGLNKDKLILRSYQEELAREALKGKNCIIVAPTGSGKTHVAMYIIENHIKNIRSPKESKVIFLVPTVALVDQQKSLLQKYLKKEMILAISGGDVDGQLPLVQLIPLNDIIVMTPQILCNNLEKDKSFSLSLLSLMIFDECHHAIKEHPYTKIMGYYIDIQLSMSQEKLPQIVGLTASVGVGKAKTNEKAKEYILKLCANLDCSTISKVRENLKELQESVNQPEEKTQELVGRQNDPFNLLVVIMMKQIENHMINSKEAQQAEQFNAEIKSLMKPPHDRIGDAYNQWRNKIFSIVTAFYDQSIRRLIISCLDYLKIFNEALLINADCRTKDAYKFCEKKFSDLYKNSNCNHDSDIDLWLKKLWENSQYKLKAYSEDPSLENPKLQQIKKEISEFYNKNKDMRCILFCRTRDMTQALVNWMQETKELQILNPTLLVGTNAPANKAGMTSVQQDDALRHFKEGMHKIIVATSVAEEGLDVQKCNLVIRYEHVTDSISRVQSRGRARAADAKFLLISEKGRSAASKEVNNKIREKMMEQAIEEICKMRYQEKQNLITKYQNESQIERTMASSAKLLQKTLNLKNDQEKYELRCLRCDQFVSNSDNIRKIEDSHHVVLDPNYVDRINILPHPNPIQYGLNFEKTGKTRCKQCNADFGIQAIYKSVVFFVIKPESFVIINLDKGNRQQYKKWKKVPFKVESINDQDLRSMMEMNTNNYNSTNISTVNDYSSNNVCEDDADSNDADSSDADSTLNDYSTFLATEYAN